jgi:hypothetical protein
MSYMTIIYKATNTFTGEAFIGITSDTLDQIKESHNATAMGQSLSPGLPDFIAFHDAIREYSPDAFVWEILKHEGSQTDCVRLIDEHETDVEGYNTQFYTRELIDELRKPPAPANVSPTPHSQKPKKPASKLTRGRKRQLKALAQNRAKLSKTGHSEETKKKMSKAKKGKPRSEAAKQAISEGHATHKESGLYYQDPDYKKKMSESVKAAIAKKPPLTEKEREVRSKGALHRWYKEYGY